MHTYLTTENIKLWIEKISEKYFTLVPTLQDNIVEFNKFDSQKKIVLDKQTTTSAKKTVFPQTETLLNYKHTKNDDDTIKIDLKENLQEGKLVVFGTKPCDVRGFIMIDRVFVKKDLIDPYYKLRRDNTYFITTACHEMDNTCFCDQVGSSYDDATTSDIMLYPVATGYELVAKTPIGEELLKLSQLCGAVQKEIPDEILKPEITSPRESLIGLSKNLEKLFNHPSFWQNVSEKCISCGACTYLCPSCYCFNIVDEGNEGIGKRIRTWDNCMSHTFTLEGSGHNPRTSKSTRLRNKIGHKFWYYPDIYDKNVLCCGCGRCIKHCPSNVDIREILLQAKEHEDA